MGQPNSSTLGRFRGLCSRITRRPLPTWWGWWPVAGGCAQSGTTTTTVKEARSAQLWREPFTPICTPSGYITSFEERRHIQPVVAERDPENRVSIPRSFTNSMRTSWPKRSSKRDRCWGEGRRSYVAYRGGWSLTGWTHCGAWLGDGGGVYGAHCLVE